MRQAPYLNEEQIRLFFSQFQLDLEVGIASAEGRLSPTLIVESESLSPPIMLQWSDDGGKTWSDEYWVEAGALGQYRHRAIWRRLGSGRQRTFRVTMSEPMAWHLVDAYVQVLKGIS